MTHCSQEVHDVCCCHLEDIFKVGAAKVIAATNWSDTAIAMRLSANPASSHYHSYGCDTCDIGSSDTYEFTVINSKLKLKA